MLGHIGYYIEMIEMSVFTINTVQTSCALIPRRESDKLKTCYFQVLNKKSTNKYYENIFKNGLDKGFYSVNG